MYTFELDITPIQHEKLCFLVRRDQKHFDILLREALDILLDQPDINEYIDKIVNSQYEALVKE